MASIIRCPNCSKANRVRPVARGTPRCAACHTPLPWVVDAGRESFDAEVAASVPVVVDLWAPWCGPCRMVSPVLERLAARHAGQLKVVKVNVDENPDLGGRYGAQSIPLLVLVRDGRKVDRLVGAAPEPQLASWLAPHLPAAAGAGR